MPFPCGNVHGLTEKHMGKKINRGPRSLFRKKLSNVFIAETMIKRTNEFSRYKQRIAVPSINKFPMATTPKRIRYKLQ